MHNTIKIYFTEKQIIFAVLLLIISANINAQKRYSDNSLFNKDSLTLSISIGNFQGDEEPQFVNTRNKHAYSLGLYTDLNKMSNLALDFEILGFGSEFDTQLNPPLFGTIDNETKVYTNALLFGAKVFFPAKSSFRAYLSGGLGYFKTRMIVYGSILGIPASRDDEDDSFEFYYGTGIRYMFDNWGLSLDYRHFSLNGDFAGFNISNANLGGNVYFLGLHFSL